MLKKYIFCVLVLLAGISNEKAVAEKVLIFTYSYNVPEFIEMQHKTFQRFMKDDYEFIVFNDASKKSNRVAIENTCRRLRIKCINIPQKIHNKPYLERLPGENWNGPSVRNCNVVQYSLDTVGFKHNGIVMLFDSDLFLVKDFSVKEYLNGYHLAGLAQGRKGTTENVNYLWIGLVFLDMGSMPNKKSINFNCGRVKGAPVDAGGHTHYYLTQNPPPKVRYFGVLSSPFVRCEECKKADFYPCVHNRDILAAHGFDDNQIRFVQGGPMNCEFMMGTHFLHYRGGTNWDNQQEGFHIKKKKLFKEYIEAALAN